MSTVLCILLAATHCVVAQDALDALAALKGAPSPPVNIVPPTPTPLANAAAWHEAVAIDTANNLTGTNQFFYSEIAWWQSLENSSNSYSDNGFTLGGGGTVSQILQVIRLYPVRFDQAQASDPKKTPSKYDLAEHVAKLWSDAIP